MEQTSGKGRGRASERALRSWAGIVEMIGGRLKRLRSQAFWVRLSQPRAILHGLAVMVAWLHAMLLKLPLLVVIIVLATIVIQGLTQHATVIDPISVPRDLADSGYTAEVASHRLRDAVTDFMNGVNSRMSNPDIALHGDLPKIVVPAVGISLDAIVASIRTLMHGTRSRTVSGEIVAQDKLYWLRLRLDGREIYTSKTGVALNKPDELFAGAVPGLLRQVKPLFRGGELAAAGPRGGAQTDRRAHPQAVGQRRGTALVLQPARPGDAQPQGLRRGRAGADRRAAAQSQSGRLASQSRRDLFRPGQARRRHRGGLAGA